MPYPPSMSFSGGNLQLVHRALGLALRELHNEAASCPDVIVHADILDEIDAEKRKLTRLRNSVARKLNLPTEP